MMKFLKTTSPRNRSFKTSSHSTERHRVVPIKTAQQRNHALALGELMNEIFKKIDAHLVNQVQTDMTPKA